MWNRCSSRRRCEPASLPISMWLPFPRRGSITGHREIDRQTRQGARRRQLNRQKRNKSNTHYGDAEERHDNGKGGYGRFGHLRNTNFAINRVQIRTCSSYAEQEQNLRSESFHFPLFTFHFSLDRLSTFHLINFPLSTPNPPQSACSSQNRTRSVSGV